jgi:hypothetical protein
MKITTGFLTGNLTADSSVDLNASAAEYARQLTAAIQSAFPDAEVSVDYQDASGELPYPLKTQVDGDTDALDCAAVDQIAGDLFESGSFWVNDSSNLPNYRIYDRTGSGVTHDIYAETIDDAIEAGREWIAEGDWGSDEDQDGNPVYRTIKLECCLSEIVRYPDLTAQAVALLPECRGVDHARKLMLAREACSVSATATAEQIEQIEAALPEGMEIDTEEGDDFITVTLSWESPDTINEDATAAGQSYDCSGEYSDELPECAAGGGECEVVSVTEMGDEFGTWSTGGTGYTHYGVCERCGCYHVEHNPGWQRNPDEPIKTINIKPRDEKSEVWLKDRHEDDGFLPTWLAEHLDCSISTRMSKEEALAWVAEHDDDDDLDEEDLEHVFAAITGRRANDKDRQEGLWSHVNALAD